MVLQSISMEKQLERANTININTVGNETTTIGNSSATTTQIGSVNINNSGSGTTFKLRLQ